METGLTTRGQLAAVILLIAGMWVPVTAQQEAPMQIELNDLSWSGPGEELFFFPGQQNVLTVTPDRDALGGARFEVVVEKTLPDDQTQTLQATVDAGGSAEFVLGPMTQPAVFEYEAGVVYQRGYTLRVTLRPVDGGDPIAELRFYQDLAVPAHTRHDPQGAWQTAEARDPATAGGQRLTPGDQRRVVYWGGFGVSAPLWLELSDAVMLDPDAFVVECRLNEGAVVEIMRCRLRIWDADGDVRIDEDLRLDAPGEWIRREHDVTDWPPGEYTVALYPIIDGQVWEEGPEVTYRRREPDPNAVQISHLAPWALRRDPDRDELLIDDMRSACEQWADGLPDGWEFAEVGDRIALLSPGSQATEPVELQPPLSGHYAVFAQGYENGCLIQGGESEVIRSLGIAFTEVFICAADMTEATVSIYPFNHLGEPDTGLQRLRFVPVTAESVRELYRATSRPPVSLYAVNDWCEYFHGAVRLQPDQFATILAGQAEIGLRTIAWSVGRSWVEYHSDLENTTRFPAVPLDEARKTFEGADRYRGRATMINQYRPLQTVYGLRSELGVQIWPWLAMQRHYGSAYGGIFASEFFRSNPQWWRWRKYHPGGDQARRESAAICYYFPEVRRERVDILVEVAQRGADGLLVGCCRQVPMLLYHPEMVAEYEENTGVNPLETDATDGEQYERWIRWRADLFTQVLRDLKQRLGEIEQQQDRRIPVAVRIPSSGLFYNLAAGLDVRQWLEEGLVDQLQLDPLEIWGGRGSHDVRPYLELGRQYGIPVIGGMGSTWRSQPIVALHRARGLLQAGVDGIETYETELMARCGNRRWAMPLFGNLEQLERYLETTNAQACYPIRAGNAHLGHDNHSRWRSPRRLWTVWGRQPLSL
ncbi:MAG: hypothetical protein U9R79_20210 [Armatimonadota bacterium]|nr:hypothetical protein [Armatimonadota bacterium]